MARLKRIISLSGVLLNNTWGISKMKYQYFKRRERFWELPLIAFSIIILLVMFALMSGFLAHYLYDQFAPIGQQQVLLTMGLLACQLVVFVLGIILVISTFYFADDMKILLPLPYQAYEVIAAKFGVILVNEYLSLLVLLAPILLVYGIKAQAGFAYGLCAIIGFLLAPLLPLGIACILVFPLMRFVNLSSRKELLTFIGGILLIGVVLVFQYFVQTQPENIDQLFQVLLSEDGLAVLISKRWPPGLWFTRALTKAGTTTGLGALLLFATISVGAIFLAGGIGELSFYKGLLRGMEADRGKRKKAKTNYPPHTALWAVAINEGRLFFRKAVYVLNGLAGLIVLPIMLLFPLISQSNALSGLFDELAGPIPLIAYFAGLSYSVMQSALTTLPATTFSREGKDLTILKSLPVPFEAMFFGKLVSIQAVILLGSLPGVVILGYLLGSMGYALFGFATSVFASTALSCNLMLLDLKRPFLDWTDPQQAIKSNLNAVIGMAFVFGVAALGYILVKRLLLLDMSPHGIMATCLAVSLVWFGASCTTVPRFKYLWYGREL